MNQGFHVMVNMGSSNLSEESLYDSGSNLEILFNPWLHVYIQYLYWKICSKCYIGLGNGCFEKYGG